MSPLATVAVRLRWNGSAVAQIPVTALWEFHLRSDPGGVCGALPRAFLFAHVWCDHLTDGQLAHSCKEGAPHDLLVCILSNDNSEALYEKLRGQARR
jgi:hypothetical protein